MRDSSATGRWALPAPAECRGRRSAATSLITTQARRSHLQLQARAWLRPLLDRRLPPPLDDSGLESRIASRYEARWLIAEKAELRKAELAAAERHLERLRGGRPETLETTSLHLDVLRDLKRIHSHICSVAYPVLDTARSDQASVTGNATPILEQPKPSAQSQ
jgi:hypothetical protein